MWARMAIARRSGQEIVTHAGIVGQVWRNPTRQARLAQELEAVDVRALTVELAQAGGLLLASTGGHDVADAALAMVCEPDDVVLTSDIRTSQPFSRRAASRPDSSVFEARRFNAEGQAPDWSVALDVSGDGVPFGAEPALGGGVGQHGDEGRLPVFTHPALRGAPDGVDPDHHVLVVGPWPPGPATQSVEHLRAATPTAGGKDMKRLAVLGLEKLSSA